MHNDIYTDLKQKIGQAITGLQAEGFLPAAMEAGNITVEQPKDPSHGDLATNAAMVLARPAQKNPRELAEKLAEKLKAENSVADVTIAGPGFINVRLAPEYLHGKIAEIIAAGSSYGQVNVGQGEKVNVEFVSANPTGPMHIGHSRGAVFGDALCRLLEKAGYDVTREYLINDAGGQVVTFVNTLVLRYRELFGEKVELEPGMYPGEYVIDVAKALKARDGDKWLAVTDKAELFKGLRPFAVDQMMALIKDDLKAMGVRHDKFFSEYEMHVNGAVDKAHDDLEARGLVYQGVLPPPKGKVVDDWEEVELKLFRATEFGDDTDRPLRKSDGSVTYFGADVAYHMDKLSRGYTRLINIWGADHAGTVKRLQAAIKALTGKNALEVKLMQMVRLMRDGQPLKMSKRAGNFITLREVVDEVGSDAVRFWFMSRREDSQFDFDLKKAVEQNNDNPVFYVQYAHARMCAISRQQKDMGIADVPLAGVDFSKLHLAEEVALLKHLCAFPDTVAKAAQSAEPHRIASYATELATLFHSWYAKEKFLLPDDLATTHARLALLAAAKVVLSSALDLLGVSAPEKM